MAIVDQGESPPPEVAKRQARGRRILDAAAGLILRWGYNKTTIDDIARQAGVAKGTIYLHWQTREDLFAALIQRENGEWLGDFERRVAADPAGSTLRGVFEHSALALMKRPLLKALILRDVEVIGKLAHQAHGSAAAGEKLAGFTTYLEFLREHGQVRTDLSLHQQLYMLTAVFLGFFLVAPLMPDELTLADEELPELMAETVHRALETDSATPAADSQAAEPALKEHLKRYRTVVREKLRTEMEE